MRKIFAAGALLFVGVVNADDSCNYSSAQGTEFEFAVVDESLRHFGYQLWSTSPEPGPALSYDTYVGHKGKFTGAKTSGEHGIMKFYDVILEDCSKLYFLSLKENLSDEAVELHGINWLQKPSNNWSAKLRVDDMTDAKTCVVSPSSETPYPIIVYGNKGKSVSAGVAGGDFPGKDVMFRVDKLPAIIESEDLGSANTQRLVQQIRAGGKTLLVRSYKWPDDVPDTKEFNLDGLVAELDKCKALLK